VGDLLVGGGVETIVPANEGYSFYRMPNLHFARGLEKSVNASKRCATLVDLVAGAPRESACRCIFRCD
jgi:hypothetical protein